MAAHNASASNSGRGTPSYGIFGGGTPESSGDEGSSAAARARAHRDKLLAFQRENTQRTKIHDEAADYDMTLTAGASQWMSPVQRAAALKKQQKYLRELEEGNRPEWEKKKTVLSMSFKGGKLVKTYETVKAPAKKDEPELEESVVNDDGIQDSEQMSLGHGAFNNNPLLADGKLVRPIWKGYAGKGKESPRQQNNWRRIVQDDEDNEQLILDGGLYGRGDGGQG